MMNLKQTTIIISAFLLINILSGSISAQDISDSLATAVTAEVQSVDTTTLITGESLLPDRYLFTQRLLWGEKGLMRNFDGFELSLKNREREQDIREIAFKIHRYTGYATLAGMIAQGIVGERLYNGHKDMKDLHETLAGVVNVGYFTTAATALFAPPRINSSHSGFSTYKLHKYLAAVHLSSMIATNILSGMVEDNPKLKSLHRATAYTAYASFFVSMVVIQF
jgi:hypothetical protein